MPRRVTLQLTVEEAAAALEAVETALADLDYWSARSGVDESHLRAARIALEEGIKKRRGIDESWPA